MININNTLTVIRERLDNMEKLYIPDSEKPKAKEDDGQ